MISILNQNKRNNDEEFEKLIKESQNELYRIAKIKLNKVHWTSINTFIP